jgi:hypothetical protein
MLRKLSPVERFTFLLGRDEPVSIAAAVRFDGQISPDLMKNALTKARQRHPLTAARVVKQKGAFWFESTEEETLPLEIIEETEGNEDRWRALMAQGVARLIDPEKDPLVRFVWVRRSDSSELVLICHHAISDGLSLAYFMKDALGFLRDPAAEPVRLPVAPPMEELVPPEVESQLSGNIIGDVKQWVTRSTSGGKRSNPGSKPAWKFRLVATDLSVEETDRLAVRSRENGTSVQGAIGAAFLLAFAERFGGEGSYVRGMQSPMNVRHLLAEPVGEAFGLFANQLYTEVDCSPERDFWEIARDVRSNLLAQTKPLQVFGPLVRFNQVLKLGIGVDFLYRLGKGRTFGSGEHDVTVSNLGRLEFPEGGPIQLSAFYATFSAMRDGRFVCVSSLNGRLMMSFMHDESTFPCEVADGIFADARDRLLAATAG